ncbi:MAG TPA: hypothetical protein PLO37_13875 [Candidatus Hydrogenedentes bacterium]|nr:hypothetical protein [Candidatus Hydrogenedentota bacterium]HPG67933.1 hypothetical protein [Candidatus Hydrogenedentota bacterium]
MDLETVEQRCLAHLMQVSNPLVSFDSLVNLLHADMDQLGLTEPELLRFLRDHELFTVIDPPTVDQDPDVVAELDDLGIATGTRVILTDRLPTRDDMARMIQDQLEVLMSALTGAMDEARACDDRYAQDKVLDAMSRAEKLKQAALNLLGDGHPATADPQP